jgi:hypothetical protein
MVFYEVTSQVIPVLLLALVIELRVYALGAEIGARLAAWSQRWSVGVQLWSLFIMVAALSGELLSLGVLAGFWESTAFIKVWLFTTVINLVNGLVCWLVVVIWLGYRPVEGRQRTSIASGV